MRGGIGSISGVVIGVLIFQVINYGLVYMGVNSYIQFIIKGVIILFAIAVDTQKYIRKR
jgi:methyl-galactoside transport system permease protein